MISIVKLLKEVKETYEEFAKTRGKGAEKISDNAKEKGGLSLLTWHHFKVKLPYYDKAAKGKFNIEKGQEEYTKLLNQLYEATKSEMNIGQIRFQELVGKLEVLGELLIRNKK